MGNSIIRQIPFSSEGDICPLCGNHLTERKTITVQSDYYPKYSYDFLFCPDCDLPFTSVAIGKQIREQLHFGQRAFSPKKGCSREYIKSMMSKESQIPRVTHKKCAAVDSTLQGYDIKRCEDQVIQRVPKKNRRKNQINNKPKTKFIPFNHLTFIPIKAYEFIKRYHPNHLMLCIKPLKSCPQCDKTTDYDLSEVPISNENLQLLYGLDGKYCLTCGTVYIYVKNADIKKQLSYDYYEIPHKKMKKTLDQIQNQNQTELRKYDSAVVMIIVLFHNGISEKYIIVNDKKDENREANVFHYSSDEALETLSAAFAKQRNKKGVVIGQEYDVKLIVYQSKRTTNLPEKLLPTDLTIQSGGGLYNKSREGHLEIVNMLVYSPFSQRYELMKATYDKCDEYCYVDISIYRGFVKKYGKPDLFLCFERYSDGGDGRNFDELNFESILKVFGYNVNKTDNLSSQQRQRILAEVIDLEILTSKGIISLLDFFISTHSNERYSEARYKWETDKKFVEGYKVNPQRFLIAKGR